MNKIEEMIERLCPDGVEYKELHEIATVDRGRRVVKKQLNDSGDIPVFQNSLIPLGYFSASNFIKETPFVIGAGAAGQVGYSKVDFWAADDCFPIICSSNINSRYIYHYLLSKQGFLGSHVRKASIPRISRSVVEKMKVPVPPMEIQEEIVRILDSFAELEARQRQYDFCRDSLFNEESLPCTWRSLNSALVDLRTGLNPRKNFQLNTQDAKNYYVTVRELAGNRIEFNEKTDRINDAALSLIDNRAHLRKHDILFSATGTVGRTAFLEERPKNWGIKEGVYALTVDSNIILPMFLLHYYIYK